MGGSVLGDANRGQFRASRVCLVRPKEGICLTVLVATFLASTFGIAQGGIVSNVFYTGTNDTKIQIDPEVHVIESDSQVDITSGETVAFQSGNIDVELQSHHYEVAAGALDTRNDQKLVSLAARTGHELTMTGQTESWLWWESESTLKGDSTYTDTLAMTSLTPESAPLLTAEYFFELTAYSSQILDIRPAQRPLYRLSDRIRFRASGTGLISDPINYDETFYDIHSTDPPNAQYSVLEEDVNSLERILIPEGDRIHRMKVQLEPVLEVGNLIGYASNVTADILVESTHNFLNDGPELNYYLSGSIDLRFDNSAKLLGVLIQDETGAIRTDINVSSSEGVTIPVLSEAPMIVTPPPDHFVLSPVAVSEVGLGTFSTDVALRNMIDQSGISKSFVSGVTSFDDFVLTSPQPIADGDFLNYWQSAVSLDGLFEGALEFDLGGEYLVDRLAIWNGTLEEIEVFVSDSPDGVWKSLGEFTLQDQNPLLFPLTEPEILELGDAHSARYLRVQVNSAYPYFNSETFEYAILREIAVSASAVPELASGWLLAFAMAGLLPMRKRRFR